MLMLWVMSLAIAWLAVCRAESPTDTDSLRGALEAINRRQRDLADPTLYYLDHFHPPRDVMYPRRGEGDGQPEDIGYGYQKSLASKTAGLFEAVPLPESELGSHDPGVESHYPEGSKSLENVILDYLEDNMGNPKGAESHRYHYSNPAMKRSVFRERDVNELPSALQNLYSGGEHSDQYYENGERPQVMPSSFRERLSAKIMRNSPVRNAHSLVRNFGGLNRDSDNAPDGDEDPDEYLSMLNSIWEKYQTNNPENVDPEDLSESDVEEILEYINRKQEKKRQYDDSYENGYDFFNSPLAWVKRDRQRLPNDLKHPSNQFLHALKYLNSHQDTLESLREEDVPDDEKDADVARLLMEQQASKHYKPHKKRFWRGNSYDDHHKNVKRYPIAKRSPSFYNNPAVLYHKASDGSFNQRRKKNVNTNSLDSVTDPKVAKELNNIFSPSEETAKEKSNSTKQGHNTKTDTSTRNGTKHFNESETKSSFKEDSQDPEAGAHIQRKRSGQKEEPSVDTQEKPLVMSKKSVDWSNYFGIDKRRKKSTVKPENDEWLLDQYLKAYLISARAVKDPNENNNEVSESGSGQDKSDDMDSKLQAMEDMIVDQALKYTGAHEGVTDPEEVHTVSYRVMSQLLAAFSLEKMREALREFKSSIAAQKVSSPAHTTTDTPTEVPDQKDKRVAVKKEKAEIPPDLKLEKKEEPENGISAMHSHSASVAQEDTCPILDQITHRCKEIANIAGDSSETLLPLCNLHQVCYLCGMEMATTQSGCDMTFLSEANNLCGNSPRCRYLVRRTIAAIHSLRGDPSPLGCDWQNHPCLARYVAMTMR